MSYVPLSLSDLAFAALFLLINAGISVAFALGLARSLLFVSVRMVAQLGAIGFVLKFIFMQTSPAWTLGLGCLMVLFAGREAVARQTHPFRGAISYTIGTLPLFVAGTLATIFAAALLIEAEPWYRAQIILPVLGMMLGNTLTGVALTLEALTTTAKRERAGIEARLAMGETGFVALKETLRRALKTGMMPIINAMAASGIVSLPGMMTGQILAGVEPVEATKYQLLIMFLIAGATGAGALMAGLIGVRLLTDPRQRLRLDRLR